MGSAAAHRVPPFPQTHFLPSYFSSLQTLLGKLCSKKAKTRRGARWGRGFRKVRAALPPLSEEVGGEDVRRLRIRQLLGQFARHQGMAPNLKSVRQAPGFTSRMVASPSHPPGLRRRRKKAPSLLSPFKLEGHLVRFAALCSRCVFPKQLLQ